MPPLFSDNMVLQRKAHVKLWGTSSPGVTIQIKTGWGENTSCIVNNDGTWTAKIQTPEAGGPYEIILTDDKDTFTLRNVLIGEVWLCSGQSNMEMPLGGWPPGDTILNSAMEIQNAGNEQIRFYTIPRSYSPCETTLLTEKWEVCSPETARNFSATAYFFAKNIYQELGIPVGLIFSSWGGTPVEAWMDRKSLESTGDFQEILDDLKEAKPYMDAQNNWLSQQDKIHIDQDNENVWKELQLNDDQICTADYDDSKWRTMALPTLWEDEGMSDFDGIIWFRKAFSVPQQMTGKDMFLELAMIDDIDAVYMNGVKIGGYEVAGFYNVHRTYKVSHDLINEGENVLAVRVIDYGGGGGIYGKSEDMKIYDVPGMKDVIPLDGTWKFLPIAECRSSILYRYRDIDKGYDERPAMNMKLNQDTPNVLYNAMIHPLVPYGMKGVIWYQGEDNVGRPGSYHKLFSKMITGWRDLWGQGDFPFYYVQISPYDYGQSSRSCELREAQFQTLSVPGTGMVVTLDIGDSINIHPANKQEVGRRLALWALNKNYGKDVVYSGPLYSGMEIKGNEVILSFDYVNSGLTAENDKLEHFIIAGEDRKFVEAEARIKGNKVVVSSSKVKNPLAVRYLWDNTSYASLFNKDGLPASSFRTDNWNEE